MVPADSHAQAQPAPGQQVNVGRLPRHEPGLALREDQDAGGEADPLGDAGRWANITSGSWNGSCSV
jgi:hypothetical protein